MTDSRWQVTCLRRLFARGLLVVCLAFVVLALALRFVVLPQAGRHLAEIEQMTSDALGLPVRIGKLEAGWSGLNPYLILNDVAILDRRSKAALSLGKVEGSLSWMTLWQWRPILASLLIEGPVLHVRREVDGRISLAGIERDGGNASGLSSWILEQKRIQIRNAKLIWDDELRHAPVLTLKNLQVDLNNSGQQHEFSFSADPPAELASRLAIRGEISGDPGQSLESLSGKLRMEFDNIDLLTWRNWCELPESLSQAHGVLKAELSFEQGVANLKGEVALEKIHIRLGQDLPELELASLRGEFAGRYQTDRWMLAGSKIVVLTPQGVSLAPSDFQIDRQQNLQTSTVTGTASAHLVDLAPLADLSVYLPLDTASRELLQKHRPQGRLSEIRANWERQGTVPERFSWSATFEQFGMLPSGKTPGVSGLSGKVTLTEKGGELLLDSAASTVSLPALLEEPVLKFDHFKLATSWQTTTDSIEIELAKLEFAGRDAAGSASGSYRLGGESVEKASLMATFERLDAASLWRYLPRGIDADTRKVFKRSIVAGRIYDGHLEFKGKPQDFPFRNGNLGTFVASARLADAKIDYAPGWPGIDDLAADIAIGKGLKLVASKGSVLGTRLSRASVEIPDLSVASKTLNVQLMAQGASQEFLRLIERSPLGEKMLGFSQGIKVGGNGSLDLALNVPLSRVVDTRIRGSYRFENNRFDSIPSLPPITEVNGRLMLTEKTIATQELVGTVLGGPISAEIKGTGENYQILASGKVGLTELSQYFKLPLNNYLSGSTGWQANIQLDRKNTGFFIESNLVGIASRLPEPLNKSAATPMSLRIERIASIASQEEYRMMLGRVAKGAITRRQGNWERGVLALGSAEPSLPDQGVAVRIVLPQLNADAWRELILSPPTTAEKAPTSMLALSLVTVKTPILRLMGNDYRQVEASFRPVDAGWKISLNMREMAGELYWKNASGGWLEGKLKRLALRPTAHPSTHPATTLNALPGLSLTVDSFVLGDIALGRLELKARNENGTWRLDRWSLQNPDGNLNGKASWLNVGQHRTELSFELNAVNAGKLLDRLGYRNVVRGGTAKFNGTLHWNAPPTAIDYASLTGQVTISAENGQFNKLEPGAGKLFGLISLQTLPRRLKLDFHDIFSDGFAFDNIDSKLTIDKGLLRTDGPLRIKGPAAKVEIQGVSDLMAETEDLQIVVQPNIRTAALGAAMVNPALGAATLVANVVMQKPLNRLFSYQYHVTGTWNDPKVVKTSESVPAN